MDTRTSRKRRAAARKPGRKRLAARSAGPAAVSGRLPQQARSRKRVEAILDASRALILENDAIGLKMSDVAERAGIPIGSLYQYFPTRTAIVAQLYREYLASGRHIAHQCLDSAMTRAECASAIRSFAKQMHDFNRAGTVMREVWCAVLAERAIRDIYLKEHDFYCQLLFETALRAGSPLKTGLLRMRATLAYRLLLGAMELAIGMDQPQADEYINESVEIALRMVGIADQPI